MDIKKINDDQQYRVKLTERIEVLGNVLSPGQDVVLSGAIVKQFSGSIESATAIKE